MIFISIKEKAGALYGWVAEKINDVYYRKLDLAYSSDVKNLAFEGVRLLIQQYPFEVELGLLSVSSNIAKEVLNNNTEALICAYTFLRGRKSEELIREALEEADSD